MSDEARTEEAGDAAPAVPKKAGRLPYLRRRDAVVIAVALVLSIAAFVAFPLYRAYQKVWLVNALDVPVDVEIDGVKTRVGPGAHLEVRLGDGTHALRALGANGQTIEELAFDVPGGDDAVVYNVLGAAPLFSASITYGTGT